MKILIDILHPADVNFYRNAVKEFLQEGHEIIITARPRGKLLKILEKEILLPIKIVGKHKTSKLGKIIGIITRNIQLYSILKKEKPDVVTGFGSFYIAMAAQYAKIRSVIFYDDKEYKQNYNLCKKYATTFVIPNGIDDAAKNIVKGFDFKEIAYLHPKYFKPDINVLKTYGLKKGRYVFAREVKGISLNYKDNKKDQVKEILDIISPKGLKLVLSAEDESLKKKYSQEEYKDLCIVLHEPTTKNFNSLIYYSKYVITSGDTIARDASLLGKATIYTGERDMSINKPFIDSGVLAVTRDIKLVPKIKKGIDMKKYIDTTRIIKELIINE